MSNMNKFFNGLMNENFLQKEASENESTKNALNEASPSILQKLAEELGALADERTETLQQKLAAEDEEENEEDDKEAGDCKTDGESSKSKEEDEDKEAGDCKADDESSKSEEDDDKEAGEEPSKSEEDEGEEGKEAKECDNNGPCENAKTKEEDEDCNNEGDCENEKEAFEIAAYTEAQEKLASSNMTVQDFIFEKCANDEVAAYIADNAEKLASIYDKPALQIADEILDSVFNKLG